MVAIGKSTIIANVWENFYDRMTSAVTSVTLADASVQTIQTYSSAFPDKIANTKSSYPILIINSPDIDWENFTFTKKWVNGRMVIDIFTSKAEAADLFIDKIIDSVETFRDDFRILGLMYINVSNTSKDEFFRGQIKVHIKSVTFEWRFVFTKTATW